MIPNYKQNIASNFFNMDNSCPYGGFIFDKSMDFIESQDW
ncbi:hypothetical protein WLH_03641 [Escherichia coli O25b:H4]|uniref:Uncharacterized protein n=1 Tax=Escherichia coli O25b:H4 TaxID=941280 RepID=A0A192CGN9_ECO25|nr:hypothetical protein WLH_03641 [Escherichia coli O25b:H4]KGM57910.1 hypothetical protein EL75_5030 [Escherichia coli]